MIRISVARIASTETGTGASTGECHYNLKLSGRGTTGECQRLSKWLFHFDEDKNIIMIPTHDDLFALKEAHTSQGGLYVWLES